MFLTLHSYSQLWLMPWAHTTKHAPDYQDLYNKALVAVNALHRVRGTQYQIGTTADLLYPISGELSVPVDRLPVIIDLDETTLRSVPQFYFLGSPRCSQFGTIETYYFFVSGNSDSWAKGVSSIKYSYAVELPDRGLFGFLLPASYITPTSRETFAAIKALAKAIVCKQ